MYAVFADNPSKDTGSHHHLHHLHHLIIRKKGELQEDTICSDCAKLWKYDGEDGYVMASEQVEKVL